MNTLVIIINMLGAVLNAQAYYDRRRISNLFFFVVCSAIVVYSLLGSS